MRRNIGMSTGILFKELSPASMEILEIQESLEVDIIEFGCVRRSFLIELFELDAEMVKSSFGRITLHAPNDLRYGKDLQTKRVMGLIAKLHSKFNFDLVVFHPGVVDDWLVLCGQPFPIGIENSDHRKAFGWKVDQMGEILSNTDFLFVLDVNHAFANDPSLKLTRDFATKFSDRLAEVHLSGFVEYHEPLCITRQIEILKSVPKGSCPVILEGVCTDPAQMKEELEYVRKCLK